MSMSTNAHATFVRTSHLLALRRIPARTDGARRRRAHCRPRVRLTPRRRSNIPLRRSTSPAAVTHLSTALRFETISYDDGSNAAAFESFRAWLVETYPRFHSVARRTVVGDGTLDLRVDRAATLRCQPIVLMAHQDVVPVPQPERWRHPPFSGAIVDGAIWGRGALDDKSSLIAIMEAAESLIAAGHAPARSVIFVFGHDEESGGAGARAAAELLAGRGIKAAFVLDEGGLSLRDAPRDECDR